MHPFLFVLFLCNSSVGPTEVDRVKVSVYKDVYEWVSFPSTSPITI